MKHGWREWAEVGLGRRHNEVSRREYVAMRARPLLGRSSHCSSACADSAVSLFLGGWQASRLGPTLLAYQVTADDLTLAIHGPPQRSSAPRKFFEFGQISGDQALLVGSTVILVLRLF
jgi:hypothetical protein